MSRILVAALYTALYVTLLVNSCTVVHQEEQKPKIVIDSLEEWCDFNYKDHVNHEDIDIGLTCRLNFEF